MTEPEVMVFSFPAAQVSAWGDFISAVVSIVLLLSLYFAYGQLKALVEQIKQSNTQFSADHERSRRLLSVELITQWTRGLDIRASSARKVVEKLDEDQSRKLFKTQAFEIKSEHIDLLRAAFDNPKELGDEVGEQIVLTIRQVSELRWRVITYLNQLESILAAWQHGIADRDIIENEFKFLVKPEDGHNLLERFRAAAGGDKYYPAVTLFAQSLKDAVPQPQKRGHIDGG